RPEISVKDFGEALSGPPDLVIAFDAKSFGEAANNGQMVGEAAKRSKAAESIAELALLITNQRVSASAPKSSLLARLLRGK
ncbi:MAG: pilus assembly protein CpaE, partial [Caulobacteraceae bacterium]